MSNAPPNHSIINKLNIKGTKQKKTKKTKKTHLRSAFVRVILVSYRVKCVPPKHMMGSYCAGIAIVRFWAGWPNPNQPA